MDILQALAPALADVPLTILVVSVVGIIVYRVLMSNSKSSDQLYKLFERAIITNEKLSDAISSFECAARAAEKAERGERNEAKREIISELRQTEARIIVAVEKQGLKSDAKTTVAD